MLAVHPTMLPISVSLLAGLICLLVPQNAERLRSWLAVAGAALAAGFVWPVFAEPAGILSLAPWLMIRVDSLSAFVLLAISVFGFLIALYSVEYMKGRARHREYCVYLLWTLALSFGVVIANDLILLLVCWGFLGITLYLMIGIAGPGAADAARKSLIIIGGTDALLLLGIVLVWNLTGSTQMDLGPIALDSPVATIAFLSFLAAAFAKAGAIPFHSWVPDFGEKADAPVSAFLPASLDKLLGIYLLARCVMDIFIPTPAMLMLLMLIGAVTVLAAVMMALVQHDLKRLLAFHAVSQVGYMILGIGTGTAIGLTGGLFHMLNNTLYKSCLFLSAGVVEKATGTSDMDRLGGLAKAMPFTFFATTIAALSISGIPPFNGFASKWMIYQGIIDSADSGGAGWIIWLSVAMLGSALTLASFVKVLHATFLCKPAPSQKRRAIREGHLTTVLPLTVLAVLCIAFGVFPFALPLQWLIFPIIDVEFSGVWWAGLATILILTGIALGLLVYFLTMRAGKLRRVETYIGGERMDDVYIQGEEPGPDRHLEVTGVNFYDTIEQLPFVRRLYARAHKKAFDIYHLGAHGGQYLIGILRAAHTGVLPSYLMWLIFGVLVVIYTITGAGI